MNPNDNKNRKNGKGGTSAVDAYFKKKGLKEGWKK